MKTKDQKTVINENQEQSELFIVQMEGKYLPAVSNLSNLIKGLGVTPSKELIYAAIGGDFKTVEAAYRPIIDADVNTFKSPAGRKTMEQMFQSNLTNLKELTSEIFSGRIGNQEHNGYDTQRGSFEELATGREKWGTVAMNSLSLAQFVELNELGEPVISDEAKEVIRDSFRVYASANEEKVCQAQKDAAKSLNKLVTILQETGIGVDFSSQIGVGVFMYRFFRYEKAEDGSYSITVRIEGIK